MFFEWEITEDKMKPAIQMPRKISISLYLLFPFSAVPSFASILRPISNDARPL